MKLQTIGFSISKEWVELLEQLAREESVKKKKNITRNDLIREAVKEKYNLK